MEPLQQTRKEHLINSLNVHKAVHGLVLYMGSIFYFSSRSLLSFWLRF